MATIRAYTTIEQSRKLAKILPLESADMCCFENQDGSCNYYGFPYTQAYKAANPIPLWSLAALMNYLKEVDYFPKIQANEYEITMLIDYQDKDEDEIYTINIYAESFVDACYEMIIKLHELNLL